MRKLTQSLAVAACAAAAAGCASQPEQIAVPTVKAAFAQMQEDGQRSRIALKEAYPDLKEDRLEAIFSVPRAMFVTDAARFRAYDDLALPIGSGQMTLKLSDIAFLLTQIPLSPTSSVLEIGTGTGYFAAVLSRIAAQVHSVEWNEYLAEIARHRIERLSLTNVKVRIGDGMNGWAHYAPYDAVIVTAGLASIPAAYFDQLKPGGYLAVPVIVDDNLTQWEIYKKSDGKLIRTAEKKTPISPMIVVNGDYASVSDTMISGE